MNTTLTLQAPYKTLPASSSSSFGIPNNLVTRSNPSLRVLEVLFLLDDASAFSVDDESCLRHDLNAWIAPVRLASRGEFVDRLMWLEVAR